jgi:hypothetical protein
MKKLLLAAGLLALSAPSFAADAPGPQGQASGEKMRCKRIPETGSNVRAQKICRTEREWNMIRDKGRKEASDLANPTGGMRTGG